MRINNNIMAMNAHRQLAANQESASKSMEKLSSGFRINRAGDDAAGLAISEKMRSQIRGLQQATRNAQDGISLIQTAEGTLNETHTILRRMRELAVQSATDTNTLKDRSELQKEVDQLASEISRISNTTEFNTKNLMAGGLNILFHIGANEQQNVTLGVGAMDAHSLGVAASSISNSLIAEYGIVGIADVNEMLGDGAKVVVSNHKEARVSVGSKGIGGGIEGFSAPASISFEGEDDKEKKEGILEGVEDHFHGAVGVIDGTQYGGHINEILTITVASVEDAKGPTYTPAVEGDGGDPDTPAELDPSGGASTVKVKSINVSGGIGQINGQEVVLFKGFEDDDPVFVHATVFTIRDVTFTIEASETNEIGQTATINFEPESFDISLENGDGVLGSSVTVRNTGADSVTVGDPTTGRTGTVLYNFDRLELANEVDEDGNVVKDDDGNPKEVAAAIKITQDKTDSTKASVDAFGQVVTKATVQKGINISTQGTADKAVRLIDRAVERVSAERAQLGAMQNRLEHTIANLGTSAENLQAAEARIRDLDMAEEIMGFTKEQILQQAATAMLAQANMAPQTVLQLLG